MSRLIQLLQEKAAAQSSTKIPKNTEENTQFQDSPNEGVDGGKGGDLKKFRGLFRKLKDKR